MGEKTCACGRLEWVEGKGWPHGHGSSSCMVGNSWVSADTFRKPAFDLVVEIVGAEAKAEGLERELRDRVRYIEQLEEERTRAREAIDRWRRLALAGAEVLAAENQPQF